MIRSVYFLVTLLILGFGTTPAIADLYYTAYRNGGVSRVDETSGELIDIVATSTGYRQGFDDFRGLALAPDGTLCVSSRFYGDSRFGRWGVWQIDPITGDLLGSVPAANLMLDHIAFGPDGDLYGVDGWTEDLERYDPTTGSRELTILAGVGAFTFLPDGSLFVATSASRVARYDAQTGEQLGSLTDLEDLGLAGYRYDGMAVGPDGDVYAAYNYRFRDQGLPGGVLRFDGATGNFLGVLVDDVVAFGAASGGGIGVAFGPRGELLVGSLGASVLLRYDSSTGDLLGSFPLVGNFHVTGASHIVFIPVPEPISAASAAIALAICVSVRCVWRRQERPTLHC